MVVYSAGSTSVVGGYSNCRCRRPITGENQQKLAAKTVFATEAAVLDEDDKNDQAEFTTIARGWLCAC